MLLPNYRQLKPMAPLKPLKPGTGKAYGPGEAAIPMGQTPVNPWGQNRGGSGQLPLYRRTNMVKR